MPRFSFSHVLGKDSIVRRRFIFLGIIAISVAVSGSAILVYSSVSHGQMRQIDLRTVTWGYKANYTKANLVISDNATWANVWKQAAGNASIPQVNFSNSTVIAMFAGVEPTSGYAINATSLTGDDSHILVLVTLTTAGNCIVEQNLTAPFDIIAIPKTGLRVQFSNQTIASYC